MGVNSSSWASAVGNSALSKPKLVKQRLQYCAPAGLSAPHSGHCITKEAPSADVGQNQFYSLFSPAISPISIHEVARQVLSVAPQVEKTVPTQVEQDILALAALLALKRLIDGTLHRMCGLRSDDHHPPSARRSSRRRISGSGDMRPNQCTPRAPGERVSARLRGIGGLLREWAKV